MVMCSMLYAFHLMVHVAMYYDDYDTQSFPATSYQGVLQDIRDQADRLEHAWVTHATLSADYTFLF